MNRSIPVYSVPHEQSSPVFARSFLFGMERLGQKGSIETEYQPGPWAGFGSPANWGELQQTIRDGHPWWFGDHAYFHRWKYFRVTRNRFQHNGEGEGDRQRFLSFGIPIQPWRKSGGHVLICPPGRVYASLHGFDCEEWLKETLLKLRHHTDRPLRVRRKSRGRSQPIPLSEDLKDCWALVTFMSNAALESVLAGIPVICTGDCAGATMGLQDLSRIESPIMPAGRLQWASVLAANQWTLFEIRQGLCWRKIGV